MRKGRCVICGKETSQFDGRNGDFICRNPCYWIRRQNENKTMAKKYGYEYQPNHIDQCQLPPTQVDSL